jgi:cytochrome b561
MKNKDYSLIYRLLHWAIAISMILLLCTIFLRMYWMNKNHVSDIIQQFLATKNMSLPEDDTILLAKQIRQPMWIWHIYLGYVLVGLFALRFALPFFGEMKFSSPLKAGLSLKEKFQSWVYIVFYICVFTSLFTGMMLKFGPESQEELMEKIHVLSLYYLLAYIVLHIGGLIMAEFTSDHGIVSRIIGGKKKD